MTSREFEEFDGILPDPPDIREPVSPTWLEAYVRCPFAFMLEKIWKVPLSVPADVAASPEPLKRGIFLHSAVERIVEEHGFRPAPEQVQSILQAEASSCGLEKMMSAEYLFDAFLQREKRAVIESLRQIRPRTWRFIQKEISLEGKLGDLRIQGRIDLVVEDAHSRKVLLDIKSGKLPSKSGTARGRYFQLPFYYALAAGRWDPEEISSVGYLSISSRAPGGLVEFSSEEMEGMLDITAERAGTLVSMMRRGLFPPVPTRQCSGCQWSSICRTTPGWRIKQKMREDDRMEYFRGLMVK